MQALAARVSNRGRWGTDDQRGTLNLIDAAAVQRGVGAVRAGRVFSLAIPFDESGPQWDNVHMPHRTNARLLTHTVSVSFTGDPRDFTTSDDSFAMGSQAATDWDALSHAGYDDTLYNDTPSSAITADGGASRLGIEHFGPVVTRGILLDIARLHGVDYFDDGYPISAQDLQRAVDHAGVRVEQGDALLVRTGQLHWLRQGDRMRLSYPSPGLGLGSLEWLHDMQVAAVATDTVTFEVMPSENRAAFLAVHMLNLRDQGLVQGQLWNLDELADDCAADDAYEFLLAATPLPITGAVGGPVAPTATK